jgi:8-oxo-dGTP pyrophosphatase MutT (NUDIX family)
MSRNKPESWYRQSAVIPYRVTERGVEIALVTSSGGRRWVIPKGVIDPGESPRKSARREAEEEAGVLGTLHDEPIGSYSYDKWGGTCEVEVFLMSVETALPTWAESNVRRRQWMSIESALRHLREPGLRTLLRAAERRLESG